MDIQKIRQRQSEIRTLIKKFVAEKLNDDYAEIADRMLSKLGRKRYSILIEGDCEEWAAAIIHASGRINSLFDKSTQPYITVEEINLFFKTNPLITLGRLRQIKAVLNLNDRNDEFSIHSLGHGDSFHNLVMMNGCLVPRECLPEQFR